MQGDENWRAGAVMKPFRKRSRHNLPYGRSDSQSRPGGALYSGATSSSARSQPEKIYTACPNLPPRIYGNASHPDTT